MSLRKRIAAALAFTLAISGGWAAAANAGDKETPQRPPWVKADGHTVDESKLPTELVVLDANGKPKKDKDGKEVKVKTKPDKPHGPLKVDEKKATAQGPTAEGPADQAVPASELRGP